VDAISSKTKIDKGNNKTKSVQGIDPKYKDTKMLKVKEWKKIHSWQIPK